MNIGPKDSLRMLVEGNRRFASGACEHPNTDLEHVTRMSTRDQRPFAAVLTCADSRVPVERVFDRGVGDLFVVRVAGNVCETTVAASLEFAVTALACKLVVILGHTRCGAVSAACSGECQSGPVEQLLGPIRETAREMEGEVTEDRVIRANVRRSIKDLVATSEAVDLKARDGTVLIAPAVYDLARGTVDWLDGTEPA